MGLDRGQDQGANGSAGKTRSHSITSASRRKACACSFSGEFIAMAPRAKLAGDPIEGAGILLAAGFGRAGQGLGDLAPARAVDAEVGQAALLLGQAVPELAQELPVRDDAAG